MSKSADLLKAGKKTYPSFDFKHYNLEIRAMDWLQIFFAGAYVSLNLDLTVNRQKYLL